MNRPKLSIAIPTYNGAKYIASALDSVVEQCPQELWDQIEIVISDNASTDQTESIVQSYISKYPGLIHYYKNVENIGYDRNIDNLFKKSQGEFVKVLADDDQLMAGALKKHLDILNAYPDTKVLICNFDIYDEQMHEKLNSRPMSEDKIYFQSGDEFLMAAKGRYGQVSTLLFARDAWVQTDITEAIGLMYIHVYVLLKNIARGPAVILSEPLLKVRTGSPNFEKKADDRILVPLNMIKILRLNRHSGLKFKTWNFLKKEQHNYILKRIPHSKLIGFNSSLKVLKALILSNFDYPLFWPFYLPLFFLPGFIIKPLRKWSKAA